MPAAPARAGPRKEAACAAPSLSSRRMIAVSPRRGAAPRIGSELHSLSPSFEGRRRPGGSDGRDSRLCREPRGCLVQGLPHKGETKPPPRSRLRAAPKKEAGLVSTRRVRPTSSLPGELTSVSASRAGWQSPVDGLTSRPLEVPAGQASPRLCQGPATGACDRGLTTRVQAWRAAFSNDSGRARRSSRTAAWAARSRPRFPASAPRGGILARPRRRLAARRGSSTRERS